METTASFYLLNWASSFLCPTWIMMWVWSGHIGVSISPFVIHSGAVCEKCVVRRIKVSHVLIPIRTVGAIVSWSISENNKKTRLVLDHWRKEEGRIVCIWQHACSNSGKRLPKHEWAAKMDLAAFHTLAAPCQLAAVWILLQLPAAHSNFRTILRHS